MYLIPSPSTSVKIQIMDGKVCWRCKGKTLLGNVNKLLKTKTMSKNVLPLHLKQTFPPIIWIFTEGEGDGIYSRLPFNFFLLSESVHYEISKYFKCVWRSKSLFQTVTFWRKSLLTTSALLCNLKGVFKVIIEKSRGEGSLMEQDTIENVS